MSTFERSVTCSFFLELYSHIDKNSGEKFEDMFLVKIASKGPSLKEGPDFLKSLPNQRTLSHYLFQFKCFVEPFQRFHKTIIVALILKHFNLMFS